MQGHTALGRPQVHVKVNVDLEDRIRALIKAIVETTDLVALNALGAELQRLLEVERTLLRAQQPSKRTF